MTIYERRWTPYYARARPHILEQQGGYRGSKAGIRMTWENPAWNRSDRKVGVCKNAGLEDGGMM
jgi:hypothetical protein